MWLIYAAAPPVGGGTQPLPPPTHGGIRNEQKTSKTMNIGGILPKEYALKHEQWPKAAWLPDQTHARTKYSAQGHPSLRQGT